MVIKVHWVFYLNMYLWQKMTYELIAGSLTQKYHVTSKFFCCTSCGIQGLTWTWKNEYNNKKWIMKKPTQWNLSILKQSSMSRVGRGTLGSRPASSASITLAKSMPVPHAQHPQATPPRWARSLCLGHQLQGSDPGHPGPALSPLLQCTAHCAGCACLSSSEGGPMFG